MITRPERKQQKDIRSLVKHFRVGSSLFIFIIKVNNQYFFSFLFFFNGVNIWYFITHMLVMSLNELF